MYANFGGPKSHHRDIIISSHHPKSHHHHIHKPDKNGDFRVITKTKLDVASAEVIAQNRCR